MLSALTILGAGGFAEQVAWVVQRQASMNVIAFVDELRSDAGDIDGVPILQSLDDLVRDPGDYHLLSAVGHPDVRRRWADAYEVSHRFATIIDPSAAMAPNVSVGHGSVIMPGGVCSTRVKIGRHTLLGFNVSLSHDSEVGDFTHLAGGVILNGRVTVGDGCRIGAGAILLPDIKVGNNAVIGAGAVVTENVADGETVAGVPARPLKRS